MVAKCAVYAGDSEGVAVKHLTVRGPEVCADLLSWIPNYSARVSAVSAAVIRPQIPTLDKRREMYNRGTPLSRRSSWSKGGTSSPPPSTPQA